MKTTVDMETKVGNEKGNTNYLPTSYSKRKTLGEVLFLEKACPSCNHHKVKQFNKKTSPFYGKCKCCKCGEMF